MHIRVSFPRSTVQAPCRVRSRLVTTMVANKDQLTAAKADLTALINEKQCNPIMIRLAWHDSGSYNKVCDLVSLEISVPVTRVDCNCSKALLGID